MHRCVHCGRSHHRSGHLTRHYARRHPIATGLIWLVFGLPALALLAAVAIIYVIAFVIAFVLTGGKIGGPRGHLR